MTLVTEKHLECDLMVAGGGPAGVACALSAARLGARVILCQDRPVLGGNASSEVRMHIVGATGLGDGKALASELREGGLIEEIRLEMAVHNPQRSPSMMDLVLYDKCRREPNVTLLLNTAVTGADLEGGRISRVRAERPSTEERFTIRARTFADCTGDGRLGAEAGLPFRHGREARSEFGEPSAPEKADRRTLGSSLLLQAKKHDRPMPFTAPPWARRFKASDFGLRPFGRPGFDLGLEYGFWWIEWGGCLDTIKDNERIRDELLGIVLGVWDHIKNASGTGADTWALEWFGFLPGKRESRRFVGEHVLTEADLVASRPFADAIAYGGWPIDTHPPEGVDAPDLEPCVQRHLDWLYDIPLRSCVSKSVPNLVFAGRNLSATHLAFASTRVMATCFAVGQGLGTAAALALRQGADPVEIPGNPALMRAVRQQLLRDDCFLIGVRNEDPADLARSASARASSSQPGGAAGEVLSGQTRCVDACVTPGRFSPGANRWMSDPKSGLPAWLELRWHKPVDLAEVSIVFDTGLHRLLTLSQADGYTAKMLWGQAQPETVRDYTVSAETAAGWTELARVCGNYQRLRIHRLAQPVRASALRVSVTATNGLDHARICEIRAY